MADVKISALPNATTPLAGTEAVPIVQSGATVQAPANALGPALPLSVVNGGTGLTVGTSGGVLYFSASATVSSSGALTINRLVLGGGAGGAPTVVGSLGTSTTVLHGNAGGAPTFGAVALTTDVTGTLPIANGGTGQTSANAALNALLPNQTAQGGKFLQTDGSSTSWEDASATPGVNNVGYLNIPQNSQTGIYDTVLTDAGKHILYPSSASGGTTFFIDDVGVNYDMGTVITFVNMSPDDLTIDIESPGVLVWAGTAGSTGARVLAQYGMSTAMKVEDFGGGDTTWIINGVGIS